jgi:hypothetical protein
LGKYQSITGENMGVAYFVSSRGSDYVTDPEKFLRHFKQHWPDAEIRWSAGESYALHWDMKLNGYPILGGLQKNSECITIEGGSSHEDAIEIAVWYRTVVPSEINLYFWTAHTWENPVQITSASTIVEIAREFAQSDK